MRLLDFFKISLGNIDGFKMYDFLVLKYKWVINLYWRSRIEKYNLIICIRNFKKNVKLFIFFYLKWEIVKVILKI